MLSEIADVRDGTHDSPSYYSNGKMLITSKNLQANGKLDLSNVSLINEDDFNQINKRSKVDVGDILFGMIGTIGNPVMVFQDNFAIKNVALIKNSKGYNSFLIHYLRSASIAKQFHLSQAGGTQKFIGLGIIRDLEIKVPLAGEQKKIGDFFFTLDKKIQKQQEKVELLKQQKKGLMQKIFSQELRFKNENGQEFPNWVEQALGNIGTNYTGLSGKTKDDFGFGEHSFITYTNVFNNLYAKLEQIEKVNVKDEETQSYVEKNDILFTTSSETPNEVGMASIWIHESKNLHLNSFCFGYRINTEDIHPEFVAISLRSDYMRKKIVFLAQGSTRYNISKAKLMEATIKIPTLKEQNKIIAFYKKLDSQVKLEEERQKFLIAQKQAFMQQMFT
ncbi:restriction endonuclease subunit S [Psychrobacillus sp. PGGUH221]|uniref:restriction endonuclease subunit S n=1 Tax=Psychrobacillus sp. PGGUH221 TaxID=3020058 RepID=UPI0035C6E046